MAAYIQNEDNYFPTLENTEKECFFCYIRLINDYISLFNAKITHQNAEKNAFIAGKGLETIRHVFMHFLVFPMSIHDF